MKEFRLKEKHSYEQTLVQKIRCGDESAFREAFYAYKDRLFSFCYRFTRSEELAEELVHDALLKVWANRQNLDEQQSFIGYLYTITRNNALNYLKKKAAEETLKKKIQPHLISWHNDTEENLHYANLQQIANLAVDQLPVQQQRIFRMSRDQHMTHEEIAQNLNLSPHTVRNHIIKALHSIKKYLSLHTDISLIISYLLASYFLQ